MRSLRISLGLVSVGCLAAAFNIAVLRGAPFAPAALVPLAVGVLFGLVWTALSLTAKVGAFGKGQAFYGFSAVVSSTVFLMICIVIYAFSKHWDQSWDLTREGRRELSEQTVQVLENLDQDVSVIGFFVKTGDALLDVAREKTRRFLERCQRHTTRLDIEFVDPQEHPEQLDALNVQRISPPGAVVIRAGARQKEIPLSDVTARLEERDFTNALINVIRDAEPRVCFLTGHGESRIDAPADDPNGATELGMWLLKEAYQPESVAIRISRPEVPAECNLLVINGPDSDLHPLEIAAIDDFIRRGGRLLVFLDPWIVTNRAEGAVEHLRPWLAERFGILVGNNVVISGVKGKADLELYPDIGLDRAYDYYDGPDAKTRSCFDDAHPITRGFDHAMYLHNARTVTLKEDMPQGVAGREILRSAPGTWAETNLALLQTQRQAAIDSGELEGSVGLAAAVTVDTDEPLDDSGRAREARIVVVGDADLTLNSVADPVHRIGHAGHHNFILNAVAWLCENEELIAIRPTAEENEPLVLSEREEKTIIWIAALGTTQAVALAGVVAFLLRRKHR